MVNRLPLILVLSCFRFFLFTAQGQSAKCTSPVTPAEDGQRTVSVVSVFSDDMELAQIQPGGQSLCPACQKDYPAVNHAIAAFDLLSATIQSIIVFRTYVLCRNLIMLFPAHHFW